MEVKHDPRQQANDHCRCCPRYIQIGEAIEANKDDEWLRKHVRRVERPGYQVKGAQGWVCHAFLEPSDAEVYFESKAEANGQVDE